MGKIEEWEPPTAQEIRKRWGEVVDDMLDIRRNYWLNYSFYAGDQWVGWNDSDASVQLLDFTRQASAKNRTTVNKFKPRVISQQARLLKTPLAFEPHPGGVDAGAVKRAQLERQVLEVEARRRGYEHIRRSNVFYALLGGVSAITVEPDWEYHAEPVQDMLSGDWLKVPSRPAVKLTALSAAEFGLEPGSRDHLDARWWIRCTTLTPNQVKVYYQLDEEPPPDSDASDSPMHRALRTNREMGRKRNTAVCVFVYYERPSDITPGCVVHVVGDKVVKQDPWPFPFEELNVHPFVQSDLAGTWKGDTILNDARQLQVNYNRAFTSINNHIGRTDNARMLVPYGAQLEGDDEMSGDAGEYARFDPAVGRPEWMQAPEVPRWLREHIDQLGIEMDDLFSTHAATRGESVGDRTSGLAYAQLAEKDDTPLGLMAVNQQQGWQHIAEQVIATMRYMMTQVDEATAQQAQANGTEVSPMAVNDVLKRPGQDPLGITWTAADLSEFPVIAVPLESVMPRSMVATQAMMISLKQAFPEAFQGLGPAQLAAILATPDPTAFAQVSDAQITEATWENSRMVARAGDEEVQVTDWQDHGKHITQHNVLRASSEYRQASPEVQTYVDQHIDAHTVLAAQQLQAAQGNALVAAAGNQPAGPKEPSPQGAPAPADQGAPVAA